MPRSSLIIIGILLVVVFSLFIFQINTDDKLNTFIKKFDDRTKISDQRFSIEHAGDMARTKGVDKLLNETHHIINDLIYIMDIRLSNHTIHTDKELGSVNGNLTRLLRQGLVTGDQIIGNISHHRIIANATRDEDLNKLNQIKAMVENLTRRLH